jgi:hypothetical protein
MHTVQADGWCMWQFSLRSCRSSSEHSLSFRRRFDPSPVAVQSKLATSGHRCRILNSTLRTLTIVTDEWLIEMTLFFGLGYLETSINPSPLITARENYVYTYFFRFWCWRRIMPYLIQRFTIDLQRFLDCLYEGTLNKEGKRTLGKRFFITIWILTLRRITSPNSAHLANIISEASAPYLLGNIGILQTNPPTSWSQKASFQPVAGVSDHKPSTQYSRFPESLGSPSTFSCCNERGYFNAVYLQ